MALGGIGDLSWDDYNCSRSNGTRLPDNEEYFKSIPFPVVDDRFGSPKFACRIFHNGYI